MKEKYVNIWFENKPYWTKSLKGSILIANNVFFLKSHMFNIKLSYIIGKSFKIKLTIKTI